MTSDLTSPEIRLPALAALAAAIPALLAGATAAVGIAAAGVALTLAGALTARRGVAYERVRADAPASAAERPRAASATELRALAWSAAFVLTCVAALLAIGLYH